MLRERKVVDHGVRDVPEPFYIVFEGIDIGKWNAWIARTSSPPSQAMRHFIRLGVHELWLTRQRFGEGHGVEGCHGHSVCLAWSSVGWWRRTTATGAIRADIQFVGAQRNCFNA